MDNTLKPLRPGKRFKRHSEMRTETIGVDKIIAAAIGFQRALFICS